MGCWIPWGNNRNKKRDITISFAYTSKKYLTSEDNDQYSYREVPKSNFITQNIVEEVKIDTSIPKVENTSIKHQLLASKDIHLPNISTPEELFKIKTTTEHKLTPEEKNEVFGKGANGFKEHYENLEIDSDAMNTAVTVE